MRCFNISQFSYLAVSGFFSLLCNQNKTNKQTAEADKTANVICDSQFHIVIKIASFYQSLFLQLPYKVLRKCHFILHWDSMKISFDKMILLLKCFVSISLQCAKLENIQIMLQNQSPIIPVKAQILGRWLPEIKVNGVNFTQQNLLGSIKKVSQRIYGSQVKI